MLLGHIGIGIAGKSLSKRIPLWGLLIAVMIPDLMSVVAGLIGVSDETGFWSHSLLMTAAFALVAAPVVYLIFRSFTEPFIFAGLILSHWVCDFISWPLEAIGLTNGINLFSPHRAYGLGLYKTMLPVLISEIGLLALGVSIYIISRKRSRKIL